MSELKALQASEYSGKFWQKAQSFSFTAQDNFSILSILEITEAAANLPIIFIKQGDEYLLAALQSFEPNRNLYVNDNGVWLGMYRPMGYSFYPFCITEHEGKRIVCERSGSGLITQSTDGMPLFDANGENTPEFEQLLGELNRYQASLDRAAKLVTEITKLDLLSEWPIQFQSKGETVTLSGVYRIDEEKLNSLPGSKFAELKDSGILRLCYFQLVSMYNIKTLYYLHKNAEKATNFISDTLDFDSGGSINFDNL